MSGSLFIVSAPSGAGKTTLVRGLLDNDPKVRLSVSYTTRKPREGELDGVAYNFTNIQDFLNRRNRGEFLEWAEVHGNFYASSRVWLEEQMRSGQDVLLEIDWQGAEQVRKLFPEAVSIFVMPPSFSTLEKRLHGRGTDSPEVIQQRIAAAVNEMRKASQFDYVIINDNLQTAIEELRMIVQVARLRTSIISQRNPEIFPPAD